MFGFNVATIVASVLLLQALPPMAASPHVLRSGGSGVIANLLRARSHPAHDLQNRQTTCPIICADNINCCDSGYYCATDTVSGAVGCCLEGLVCYCEEPGWLLCPAGDMCCPPDFVCYTDGTCAPPDGGPATTVPTISAPEGPSTVDPSAPSSVAPVTTSGTPTVSAVSSQTTKAAPQATTTRPNNGGVLTAGNSLSIFAAVVVGFLPFID